MHFDLATPSSGRMVDEKTARGEQRYMVIGKLVWLLLYVTSLRCTTAVVL